MAQAVGRDIEYDVEPLKVNVKGEFTFDEINLPTLSHSAPIKVMTSAPIERSLRSPSYATIEVLASSVPLLTVTEVLLTLFAFREESI